MFIPYQAIMIPLQSMMLSAQSNAPWFQGIVVLILCHTVYGIPICTLIFRNYYATAVPNEIVEAARVDGAGTFSTYGRVVLPISIPGFVVALIWQFTSAWNDFLFALFLTTPNNGPVTYALQALAGGQNPDYPSIMAGVLVASLPTLIVYVALGRYFISGLMSGSVK
jgi:glucose/mannose transport system permease protein